MKYFFYVVRSDTGFAPNPFYKLCTLATCKPKIRKTAKEGDWIIGFYSRAKSVPKNYRGKLIYAMQITKKINYSKYWKDKPKKRYSNKTSKSRCGDNIYHKNGDNWIQEKNQFHNGEEIKKHDTQTDAVLISSHFFYFGKNHVQLPEIFKRFVSKLPRGHKYKDMEIIGKKLIKFLEKKYINKKYGEPIDYKKMENICNSQKPQKKDSQIKSQGYGSSFKLCG